MRYPVNNFKSEWNTTAGYSFGAKTSYGYHEGVDINKNGGGNIELGEPIFAIYDGKLEYYHKASHPTKNFGFHSVYKIEGSFGTRWVHQAHCMEDITTSGDVLEGNQIGRVGNSGTTYAHIHFAIFKVDPATLPQGIDTIATTEKQLHDWWEDPIAFIESNFGSDDASLIDQLREERDRNWNLYQGQIKVTEQKDQRIKELEGGVRSLETEKAELHKANTTLMEKNLKLVEAIEKDTREDYDFELKYIELEDRYKDLEAEIEDIALVLGVEPTSNAITEAITNIVNEKPVKVKKIDSLAEGITLILNFLQGK